MSPQPSGLHAGRAPRPATPPASTLCKTDRLRQALARREPMAPALRMWLITVDGRRTDGELLGLARQLGLDGRDTVERLLRKGWLQRAAGPAAGPRLADAKMFAIDLATRMLAGQEGDLREAWRRIADRDSFDRWIADCAARIALASGAERAGLFTERVSAVLDRPAP